MTSFPLPPYLAGSLYFLIVWLIVFLFNKNDRKEQWLMSGIGAVIGPLAQKMHLVDWWNPQFMANTWIHIEDVIFGFAVTGIAAVLYDVIYVKKLRRVKKLRVKNSYLATLLFLSLFALFGLFFFFGVYSFITNIIAAAIGFILIAIKRHDLVASMLVTGVLLTIIAFPAYLIGLAIDPNWIISQWYLSNLSGVFFFEIPIEEFVWFFTVGVGSSALYELAYGIRLIKKKR